MTDLSVVQANNILRPVPPLDIDVDINVNIDEEALVKLNQTLTQWIRDLYHDTDTNGYLLKQPSSLCAKKAKQLVEYTLTKSSELSSIRFHRKKTAITSQYFVKRSLYFFLETFFPGCIAVFLGYMLYINSIHPPFVNKHIVDSYIYPDNYKSLSFLDRIHHSLKAGWYNTPSFDQASEHIGGILGYILSGVSTLLSTTLEKGIGISLTKISLLIYCGLVIYISYRLLLPLTSVFRNCRHANERQGSLQVLEEEFILEFERMVERSVYQLLQPSIMKTFEQLLYMASKSASIDSKKYAMRIIHTFSNDYSVMYITLIQPLEQQIRKMELAEIMIQTQPSATFANTMFRLIREANEDLAIQLNSLNQSLTEIPHSMRESLVRPVQTTLDSLQPIVTEIVRRNI